MKGVQKNGSLEACIMGIDAGLDMFIFRNSDSETIDLINKLCKIVENDTYLKDKVMKSYKRILNLKSKFLIK